MISQQKYWNPVLETLPHEKIRRLQLEKFKRIFSWTYERSKFHRGLYEKAGIKPEDIRSFEDIRRVPTVEKSMMRGYPAEGPLPLRGCPLRAPGGGDRVPTDERHHRASPFTSPTPGRTGSGGPSAGPTSSGPRATGPRTACFSPSATTSSSLSGPATMRRRRSGPRWCRAACWTPRRRILKIQELQCTAMMATPTYVLGMADTAKEDGHRPCDPSPSEGSPAPGSRGPAFPTTKKRMEEAWGAKVYDHAGATEIGAWCFECEAQSGGLHVNEAFFLVEIQDVETGEYIEEPGRQGQDDHHGPGPAGPALRPLRLQGHHRMGPGTLPLRQDLPPDQGRGGRAGGRHHQGQGGSALAPLRSRKWSGAWTAWGTSSR